MICVLVCRCECVINSGSVYERERNFVQQYYITEHFKLFSPFIMYLLCIYLIRIVWRGHPNWMENRISKALLLTRHWSQILLYLLLKREIWTLGRVYKTMHPVEYLNTYINDLRFTNPDLLATFMLYTNISKFLNR